MFKFELKNYIEQLKENYNLKNATFQDFTPLIGILAVCMTIAVFWNADNSIFLKTVGFAMFLALFWSQLRDKVRNVIVEIYLMQKRSRYGYLRSILKNIAYSILISAIILTASLIFDKIEVGLTIISVTFIISIVSSIRFLKDKKPIYTTSADFAMRRREIIDLFKSRYGFEISLVRDLAVIDSSVVATTRLGYLDYYLNVMKDYDAWMKLDLEEAARNKSKFFDDLEKQIFDYAADRDQVDDLNVYVSKAIKAVVRRKIDITHYLD